MDVEPPQSEVVMMTPRHLDLGVVSTKLSVAPAADKMDYDASVEQLVEAVEKITLSDFMAKTTRVTNLQIPGRVLLQFSDPNTQASRFFNIGDLNYLRGLFAPSLPPNPSDNDLATVSLQEKAVTDKVVKRIVELRQVLNIMLSTKEFVNNIEESRTTVWDTNPMTVMPLLSSGIYTLLFSDQTHPERVYLHSYKLLKRLLVAVNLVASTWQPMEKEEKSIKDDIKRSFQNKMKELSESFATEMVELQKAFPNAVGMFWKNAPAITLKHVPKDLKNSYSFLMFWLRASAAADKGVMGTANTHQVIPKFTSIMERYTVVYLNLLEAYILNMLGWPLYYPVEVAKVRGNDLIWPDAHRFTSADYLNSVPAKWRWCFTKPAGVTSPTMQAMYWKDKLQMTAITSREEREKLLTYLETNPTEASENLFLRASLAVRLRTVIIQAKNLHFLIQKHRQELFDHLKRNNQEVPTIEEDQWLISFFDNAGTRAAFGKLHDSLNFPELAAQVRDLNSCVLQLQLHPICYIPVAPDLVQEDANAKASGVDEESK